MIEEADALDFPLLELPYGHSLASVADITNRHLYQIYDEKMARPMAIQRQLHIASIRPDSLHEIARESVAYMGHPVLNLRTAAGGCWHGSRVSADTPIRSGNR